MKRLFIIIIASIMIFASMTGCFSKPSETVEPKEVGAVDIVDVKTSGMDDNTEHKQVPAFPGALGGGMYTTGGRGGEVYEVTNLKDSGPGSLRDAVSRSNRTIVFRVGGVIELLSDINAAPNITIAGQTAPGDGITVTGRTMNINDNTIVRYMRFRLGDRHFTEADAFGARNKKDIIIDHSSFSWSVDEVMSIYGIENLTVQWSIISEAMHLSRHVKGKHGYGGIWGGKNTSFHHNLFAHNSSRNPAFDSTKGNSHDFSNNVVYNWGHFSTYGGKEAFTNMTNNYYKPGPDTENVRFMNAETNGSYYLHGNIMEGHPEWTDDNWKGVHTYPDYIKLDKPVAFEHPLPLESANDAYLAVLKDAGATLPRRDAIDARIISDVMNGTGRHINSQDEVGGYPAYPEVRSQVLDQDHDGMDDEWERKHGLDPNDPEDRNKVNEEGYTYLEVYLNSLVSDSGTANPSIKITSPSTHHIGESGDRITIHAETSSEDEPIQRVEFYANATKLGEVTEAPYEYTWDRIPDGTYFLTAIAFNESGASTASAAIPIHMNTTTPLSAWNTADIGDPAIPGHASLLDGKFTIKGAGKTGSASDSFHYVYQTVKGDFEFTARIDEVSANDSGSNGGMMVREQLTPDSAMLKLAVSYEKGGNRVMSMFRSAAGSEDLSVNLYPEAGSVFFPVWVKLAREASTLTAYMSHDGNDWIETAAEQVDWGDQVYIGMYADPNQSDTKQNINYNETRISEVTIR